MSAWLSRNSVQSRRQMESWLLQNCGWNPGLQNSWRGALNRGAGRGGGAVRAPAVQCLISGSRDGVSGARGLCDSCMILRARAASTRPGRSAGGVEWWHATCSLRLADSLSSGLVWDARVFLPVRPPSEWPVGSSRCDLFPLMSSFASFIYLFIYLELSCCFFKICYYWVWDAAGCQCGYHEDIWQAGLYSGEEPHFFRFVSGFFILESVFMNASVWHWYN